VLSQTDVGAGAVLVYASLVADRKTAILDAAIAVIARSGVRGLRVEDVAATAGVAVSLLYYHFGTRNGLVRAALDHANERAASHCARAAKEGCGYGAVRRMLLSEFDDVPHVRETSVVWGEVLASAVFDSELRDELRAANETWVALVARRIGDGQSDGSVRSGCDRWACAEALTSLVDGLSARWLAGLLDRDRACELLDRAINWTLRPEAVAQPA
jgi:AcrR family transcriptional regulator